MSDLTLYYQSTINLVKGEYTYIFLELRDNTLVGKSLRTGESFKFKAEDIKKLNNVKLGFINTVLGAFAITRIPTRSSKEGISMDTVRCDRSVSNEWLPMAFPKEFINMLENKYPSLEEALRIAEYEGITVAFCKEYAVNNDEAIIDTYGQVVGLVVNGKISLFNELKRKRYVE